MLWIDVKHVRMFVEVAERQSFTRAAAALQIAQPWLSVQIRKLEESFGFPLFSRGRKQIVELTSKAEELLPAAYEFLDAQKRMITAAGTIRRGESLMLLIGAPEFSVDIAERHDLIARLTRIFPKIEIDILNAYSVNLIEKLRGGELDVSFMLGPIPMPEFETLVIASTRLALLLPGTHPLAAQENIRMDDLAGLTVGNFRRKFNPPVYDVMAEAFADRGVTLMNSPESTIMGMCHFVAREHKPALVSQWFLNSYAQFDDMIIRPIVDPFVRLEMVLARRKGDRRPAVVALWECAKRIIAENERLVAA